MSQKLILPINKAKLTASWKTDVYKAKYGFTHYGADMVSVEGARVIYASGNGTVAAVGRDNVVGNVVAVIYRDAQNHLTGQSGDMVFRYFHLAEIHVKAGQDVTKDTALGNYGNTGILVMSEHLHIEADTDVSHPLYTPTVSSSNFLKGTTAGANDKTMRNPLEWLYVKPSAPENQTYVTVSDAFIREEDKALPDITEKGGMSELETLRAENGKLRQNNAELGARIYALENRLKQINVLST